MDSKGLSLPYCSPGLTLGLQEEPWLVLLKGNQGQGDGRESC